MSIERKDRSFDRILDEVEVHQVPANFIMSVQIVLMDGSTVDVGDLDQAQLLIENISREEVADVNISLDYEAIKTHVTGDITRMLDSYFKDDEDDDTDEQ
jgi:hypothetical protein